MTAMIEKTKEQLLAEFNAWYDEREREEKRGGKAITSEEVWGKAEELDVVDEFIDQERQAVWLERQKVGEAGGL